MLVFMQCRLFLFSKDCHRLKHTGVRSLFNRHYIKTGKVSKELAQIYNDLFERRQESDYMDFVSFEEFQVIPWIAKAETFVEQIKFCIKEYNKST